ncbi:MAG TPA: dienelactone hydrolase family protein [Bryobacteraceae bacterium]|nr:dienelactone hydrolase family protein [Bryobacteraceae bacterium]
MQSQLAGVDRRQFLVTNPDAGHAFKADYRPSYNKEAAEDGWKRLQQWFKKYGAA